MPSDPCPPALWSPLAESTVSPSTAPSPSSPSSSPTLTSARSASSAGPKERTATDPVASSGSVDPVERAEALRRRLGLDDSAGVAPLVDRDFSPLPVSAGAAGPSSAVTPAARRIESIMSAFFVLVLVFTDSACAMAWSSSRSLPSNTERSSCCSAVIGFLVSHVLVGEWSDSTRQGIRGGELRREFASRAPPPNAVSGLAASYRANQGIPPTSPKGRFVEAKVDPYYRGRSLGATSPPHGAGSGHGWSGETRAKAPPERRRGRRPPPWARRSG